MDFMNGLTKVDVYFGKRYSEEQLGTISAPKLLGKFERTFGLRDVSFIQCLKGRVVSIKGVDGVLVDNCYVIPQLGNLIGEETVNKQINPRWDSSYVKDYDEVTAEYECSLIMQSGKFVNKVAFIPKCHITTVGTKQGTKHYFEFIAIPNGYAIYQLDLLKMDGEFMSKKS
jgi:hypothetical protein